jgi:hypothetical protein
MKVSRGLIAGVMLTLAVPVCAQSLGELAKREQERRKAAPPAAKTYTNEDLKKITVPGAVTAPTDPSAKADGKDAAKGTDAAKGDAAKTGDAKAGDAADKPATAAKDEAAWRAQMAAAREDLRRGEAFRDALQSRINGLSADFSARDDPNQRAQIADERQKALAELARVNTDIGKAKQAIADIEEEARRANVPAGWIR